MNNSNSHTNTPSVLATLRGVLPRRQLYFSEGLRIAELQANRLLELSGICEAAVPNDIVTALPRIVVEYEADMPCSGSSVWSTERRAWIITLNALEPDTRQRFSLLHEYKHIVDHGSAGLHDYGDRRFFGQPAEEYLADYFAACVLMPKRLVKRAWGNRTQRTADLAALFDVSDRAMAVRLSQLSLIGPTPRCVTPLVRYRPSGRTGRRYQRAFSPRWPAFQAAA